ncbi:DUF4158 domain-containing protein [Streptomyces sp. NBC_00233]|uniref:DUF4158 domain-containing protein n=1 Tax=Streptomyces sp. NBC_00233 TaxID=2975686 RepID=UPI00224C7E72|nr:DUF4158 domain-containing protein [Streptomyces sp. NBC_00233]MCX5233217.1 DUF4158 domain-containing protein [Streptomyces sp. NBC_00233]
MRGSVHRWSSVQPCAAGPSSSAVASHACQCGFIRDGRPLGPFGGGAGTWRSWLRSSAAATARSPPCRTTGSWPATSSSTATRGGGRWPAGGTRSQLGYGVQLGHSPLMLAGYGTERTRWDHRDAIKDAYAYTDLKGDAWWRLARWLWDRCWSGNERPIVLFDLATLQMCEGKVLLPGATVLERLVTSIRERTNRKTWRALVAAPDAAQRAALTALLPVEDSRRTSKPRTGCAALPDVTGPGAGKAIDRSIELNKLGASAWDLSANPRRPSTRAVPLRLLGPRQGRHRPRRTPQNGHPGGVRRRDAHPRSGRGDRHAGVRPGPPSANLAVKQRMRTLGDLDSAALMLREAWITLAHAAADPEDDVRSGFDLLDITAMHQAARTVGELARPEAESIAAELTARYRTINQPLRRLAK